MDDYTRTTSDNDIPCTNADTPLASELLFKIFSHLSFTDIKNVRLSCRQWRQVTLMAPFITNQTVSLQQMKLESVSDSLLIEMGIPVEHLQLFGINVDFTRSRSFWTHFGPTIKTLVFQAECFFSAPEDFPCILIACPNLEVLRLADFKLGSNLHLKSGQVKLNLKELSIVSCYDIQPNLVAIFCDLCRSLIKFEFSPFGYNFANVLPVHNIGADHLVKLFRLAGSSLNEIDITWEEVRHVALNIDFEALFSVRGLSLRKALIKYETCFPAILDALARYQGCYLEEIHIAHFNFLITRRILLAFRSRFPNLKKIHWSADPLSLLLGACKESALRSLNFLLNWTGLKLNEVEITDLAILKREKGAAVLSLCQFYFEPATDSLRGAYDASVATLLGNPLHHLTDLFLSEINLSHHGLADTIFQKAVNLKKLMLHNCRLTDNMLLSGAMLDQDGNETHYPIMNLKLLQELIFECEYLITDSCLSKVIRLPNLQCIFLRYCPGVSEQLLKQLAHNNSSLTLVQLSHVPLRVTDMALENTPYLEKADGTEFDVGCKFFDVSKLRDAK